MHHEPNSRQVLILGGAGYIGSVLTRRLLKVGYPVRVLDALLYNNGFAVSELSGQPGFSFLRGDFCSGDDLDSALKGVTDVVHLAAVVGDPACRKYPEMARRINESGALALIDRLNGSGVERLVFMSTCSNYGLRLDDTKATEESGLNPQSLYAETKVRIERELLGRFGSCSFSFTILRSATAYGLSPRMRFDLTVNEFTRELALGRRLEVYDADTWRPYCHVDDISDAIASVIRANREIVDGQVFNVGGGHENYTKRMIATQLHQVIPRADIKFREGRMDPRNYRVSFQKISALLKFNPRITLGSFIQELAEAVKRGKYPPAPDERKVYTNDTPLEVLS